MFHIVLVPLDGSLDAERAARLGLALATPGRSKVVLLRVPVPEEMLVRSAQPGVTGWDLLWPDQVA
ncbi:MAG: universal stress protein, partial [Anaerolineales bacterium]